MRVFACHLLNDYSGSPKVLMQLVNGWIKNGKEVVIVTSYNREGFLSKIKGAEYSFFWYKWSGNNLTRLFNYFFSQLLLFIKIFLIARKGDIVYVNTVLPFGAALAGKMRGSKIIYHIHEVSMKPKILKWFLFKIVDSIADRSIYVSEYVKKATCKNDVNSLVLYNAIDNEFLMEAMKFEKVSTKRENVLMISSLKTYKGVFEFIELARLNGSFNFKLVLNANQSEIDEFFKEIVFPKNLLLFSAQKNTHPFYQWADLVLNLSQVNGWIETFGLTIIEAMAYKLPVIVPPVGGITELVDHYKNGFLIDSKNMELLSNTVNLILNDADLYNILKTNSFEKLKNFNEDKFIRNSLISLN
jgi:glycosyltransferase involved in cell wall biosynthesis